ncbi:ragulator complex protein LAMTOR1 isoform X2 [Eurosta solidaginis]|uniref:ragulator complex protein LAMTOR1 isoform X2 n=1 Tax=Eurosta solidaginis TaxID=178769 RepID=UPI0035309763
MEYLRPVWNCLTTFCGCIHCSEDIANQFNYEPSERTYLLADPTVHNSPALRQANLDNVNNGFSQSLPKKDENSLCRLVQTTAMNMIDVGAMDLHNLENEEYNDRIKLYSQRLQQQWNNIQHPGMGISGILRDIPNAGDQLPMMNSAEDLFQLLQRLLFLLTNCA